MVADNSHFRLRLPPELKRAIEAIAKEQGTSINSVIVEALENYFDKDGLVAQMKIGLEASSLLIPELRLNAEMMALGYETLRMARNSLDNEQFERFFGPTSGLSRLARHLIDVGDNRSNVPQRAEAMRAMLQQSIATEDRRRELLAELASMPTVTSRRKSES